MKWLLALEWSGLISFILKWKLLFSCLAKFCNGIAFKKFLDLANLYIVNYFSHIFLFQALILKIVDIQICTLKEFELSINWILLVNESVENLLKLVLKGYQKEGLDIDYL